MDLGSDLLWLFKHDVVVESLSQPPIFPHGHCFDYFHFPPSTRQASYPYTGHPSIPTAPQLYTRPKALPHRRPPAHHGRLKIPLLPPH